MTPGHSRKSSNGLLRLLERLRNWALTRHLRRQSTDAALEKARKAAEDRTPVTVLTGFLGSGKTTLFNGLLRDPALSGTAIIVNEFGEIGIDHDLIIETRDDLVLMDSGCLCCTIRKDLSTTLDKLVRDRGRNRLPAFDRVLIETTGLADPAPILHTLMNDPVILRHFRLAGVITTVDAVAGAATLDRQPEALKQAAVADRLVLTKTDLASPDTVAALRERLRRINAPAPLLDTADGVPAAAEILDVGLYDPATKSFDVRRWLGMEAATGTGHDAAAHDLSRDRGHHEHEHDHGHHHGHAHGHDHGHGHDHAHDVNRHDDHIRAFTLRYDQPIRPATLERWLLSLNAEKNADLLRFKGIVNIEGLDRPLVVQGVQEMLYPSTMLPHWPSEDRTSRLVFIVRDIEPDEIRRMLDSAISEADQPPPRSPGTTAVPAGSGVMATPASSY